MGIAKDAHCNPHCDFDCEHGPQQHNPIKARRLIDWLASQLALWVVAIQARPRPRIFMRTLRYIP